MLLETYIPFYNQRIFFSLDKSFPKAEVRSEIMSLAERIRFFGKIRFLFICDENVGRSPMLEGAMKKRLQKSGLNKFVEAVSAGTDVSEKYSDKKFGGKAHPRVKKEMKKIHKININRHKAKQLSEEMIASNTIAVVLNDPAKLKDYVKKKSLLVIGHRINDPYEADVSLGAALTEYNEEVWSFVYGLFSV